jgi:hypothetical protein
LIATDIDLSAEIARVQGELIFFREECLPAFFGTPIHHVFQEEYAESVCEKIATRAGAVWNWERATCRLAELLPLGPLAANASTISREHFREFLFQPPTPSFCVRERRIIWDIGLFVERSFCAPYCPTFPDLPSALENKNLPARLSDVRRWLMSLSVDSTDLANVLCMVLPFVADADPAFAKLALDPETWLNLILADREMAEERRVKLIKCVGGQWFGHILNNALLHVLGALASNHFSLIGDYLDHPYICGGYTHLMPHYLFAVLFEKVGILRQLAKNYTSRDLS